MGPSDLPADLPWRETSSAQFPRAAVVVGQWWVLRVNSFPEHPIYTVFVGGERHCDLDELPDSWAPRGADEEWLSAAESDDALVDVVGFRAYGSESGQPCDNPMCCG